ncbi:MAG: class I mannose-6-phosphate isomerase [Phycisphaeraceae bacterium]
MRKPNYDKFPYVAVPGGECVQGWDAIADALGAVVRRRGGGGGVLVVDCYTGVFEDAVRDELATRLNPTLTLDARDAMKPAAAIDELVAPFLGGDDPVFGYLSGLTLPHFFDDAKLARLRDRVAGAKDGLVLIVGCGAAMIHPGDVLCYADMPRWEAQQRQRRSEIANLGVDNHELKASLQYKRSFFIDWRVCDRWKQPLLARMDFALDTTAPATDPAAPKLAAGDTIRAGLARAATQPFRVVPFFDPGPWGGQWMKEAFDMDRSAENYAWGFDCVPEENSLLLGLGDARFELPSINVVFRHPRELLGDRVHGRFGTEFPIRFDFLDTIEGGHLSFQVHPLTEYVQNAFGMHYTQDESYYMLDADDEATVYLGVKEGVDPDEMIAALKRAQAGDEPFDADQFAARWPAKKHDHFLIPAGTVHCSGRGSMVLEISATPYIFTFKLWDWGRLGLDGLPRPINIAHGQANIAWDRTAPWVERELINRVEVVAEGEGWCEERTGLHEREFIETRRHWFTGKVPHDTAGGVNVLNLVEGEEAIVECPNHAFEPFIVHYAETFIVPASVGRYTIRPHGKGEGQRCATMKAYVR